MIKNKIINWAKENKDEILFAFFLTSTTFCISRISVLYGKQNGYLTAIGDMIGSVTSYSKF